ncbi:MAG: hypothetical protein FJ290_27405 [Planctomycetes bacterium]|nr:hypothetical protein [Planctomycetota bacterium]
MRPTDFHDIAQFLLQNFPSEKGEAAERTAVSRIYYAAFLHARDFLIKWGLSFGQASAKIHLQVCEGLRHAESAGLREVGHSLAELHRERRRADYETTVAQGFNMDTIEGLYADVVPGLADSWARLTSAEKARERAMVQGRITQIAKSSWA